MNETTEKIYEKNLQEVSEKIKKIEDSLIGVSYHSTDEEGNTKNVLPYPINADRKTLEHRMLDYGVPGLCIAVISNFALEWVKCYGVKNSVTRDPITIDTIFQAASISKPIVSVLTLNLVEKKILDLDEPVNMKLKDWKIPDNEFTRKMDVTLRNILTHTSGINMPFGGFGREEDSSPTLIQTLKGEYPAKNHPLQIESQPGTKHQYSNFGFILLEKLLQDVTGKKLNAFAKKTIFEPLGMTNSYFAYPSKDLQKQMIYPHNKNGTMYEPHVGLSPNVFGCGGLITTAHDIATFAVELIQAYLGRSDKILSFSCAKQMISKHYTLDPMMHFGSTSQGLGIFLVEKGEDFFFTHRGGGEPGSSSNFMANPKTGQGIAIMANSNVGHQLFESIKFTVAKEYNWPLWSDY